MDVTRSIPIAASSPTPPPLFLWHNDEEEYKMPTSMYGTIRVHASENVKDCIEALARDLSNTGINIRWKEHISLRSLVAKFY